MMFKQQKVTKWKKKKNYRSTFKRLEDENHVIKNLQNKINQWKWLETKKKDKLI